MLYPVPPSETERLAELKAFGILDSGASNALDALVESARGLFGMPIASVSLIDEHRQWLKAVVGLDKADTARENAFCTHTILGDDVMVVEDTAIDPRFSANPLVTGEPRIRFYAGAPLTVRPGVALGSVCLMDTAPRTITPEQIDMLRRLAVVAMALIESHKIASRSVDLAVEAEINASRFEQQSLDLRRRERQFKQTEMLAKVGGWEIDLTLNVVKWSDEIYRICEVPLGTVVTLELAKSVYPASQLARLDHLIQRAVSEGIGYDEEFQIVTASGTVKWVRAAGDVESVAGVPTRLVGIFQDISSQHVSRNELWHAANHDALTGLGNRAHFNTHLARVFVPRAGVGVGLLMIDVDHLKEVNDTLGHKAGDMLLQVVAERLSQVAVGARATVARIGGDEFAMTLKRTYSSRQLEDLGRAVVASMLGTVEFEGQTIAPRVSIGGAVAETGDSADTLRQKADLALYESKRHRRGEYAEFREEMRSAIFHRIGMIKSVDDALSEARLLPYYQPVVRLDTAEIVGVEALARIRTQDGRIVAAGAFHEAFEETRIAHRVTTQMLQQVAVDTRIWLDRSVPFGRVGINVTGADFAAGDLYSRMSDAFGREDVSLEHVLIEVTESVFMNGHERAVVKTVEQLRGAGVLVALDDFGTGFASLTHLRSLPVDTIKIDKSFVDGMLVDSSSSPIVEALIDLGRKLGLKIVAEGIETVGQAEHLKMLGCELGQGYLFARPGNAETTLNLLRKFGRHRDRLAMMRPEARRNVG